jgi:hypothetical protein
MRRLSAAIGLSKCGFCWWANVIAVHVTIYAFPFRIDIGPGAGDSLARLAAFVDNDRVEFRQLMILAPERYVAEDVAEHALCVSPEHQPGQAEIGFGSSPYRPGSATPGAARAAWICCWVEGFVVRHDGASLP